MGVKKQDSKRHTHTPVQWVVPQAWLSGSELSAAAVAAAGGEDAADETKRKRVNKSSLLMSDNTTRKQCKYRDSCTQKCEFFKLLLLTKSY